MCVCVCKCVLSVCVCVCVLVLHRRSYVFQFDLNVVYGVTVWLVHPRPMYLLFVTEPHLKCTEILGSDQLFFSLLFGSCCI